MNSCGESLRAGLQHVYTPYVAWAEDRVWWAAPAGGLAPRGKSYRMCGHRAHLDHAPSAAFPK
jgi:hypothetical protein